MKDKLRNSLARIRLERNPQKRHIFLQYSMWMWQVMLGYNRQT